jgi:para-aminobenzoate synthetase component I
MMQETPFVILQTSATKQLVAMGSHRTLACENVGIALHMLSTFIEKNTGSYIFLALSYDVKNEIEALVSENEDKVKFPAIIAFVPSCVWEIEQKKATVVFGESNSEFEKQLHDFLAPTKDKLPTLAFAPKISKETYVDKIKTLQQNLQLGDIYEINFCQVFETKSPKKGWNSAAVFQQLMTRTKAPFSAYFAFDELEVFCASPERFLERKGDILRSQPIKGTAKRSKDKVEDELLKVALSASEKERAENIMIVDLVRNDFSRIAAKDSVKVTELCGLYSFETVHQMISTVECTIKENTSFVDILKATFPMGSMTGAPKISAMKIAEQQENFKRGLYSGSIGYIKPNGDFDLNVVIRTLIHDTKKNQLSCAVGGAITILSKAEEEYTECSTKVEKILSLFHGN